MSIHRHVYAVYRGDVTRTMDYISDGIVVTGESVAMQVVVQTAGFGIFLLQLVNAT